MFIVPPGCGGDAWGQVLRSETAAALVRDWLPPGQPRLARTRPARRPGPPGASGTGQAATKPRLRAAQSRGPRVYRFREWRLALTVSQTPRGCALGKRRNGRSSAGLRPEGQRLCAQRSAQGTAGI